MIKRTQLTDWLLCFCIPLGVLGMLTSDAIFFFLALGGTQGVYLGLTSDALYTQVDYFPYLFRGGLLISIVLLIVGLTYRKTLLGKLITVLSLFVWCLVGLFGMGPV